MENMCYGVAFTNKTEISEEEIKAIILRLKKEHPDKIFKSFEFTSDGEYINISYKYDNVPFERIRRITGYLVGTLDRFNNAKRKEVEDRVKHNINEPIDMDDLK